MKSCFKFFAVAIAAIMTIGGVTLVSCDKEDSITNSSNISSTKGGDDIPHFGSIEELQQAIDAAITFDTITDLIEFEQGQGRSSIGAISDAFYESINPEIFSNENEVLTFFKDHKDVLDTIMENDEIVIMPKLSNTPYRYVANTDGMFAVQDMYYKLFKKGMVSTIEKYSDELSLITDDDLDNLDTSIFRFIPDEVNDIDTEEKGGECECSECSKSMKKWEQSNNPRSSNDRIHIVLVTNTINFSGSDHLVTRVKVYNLHKFAGTWWTSKHNLSCTGSVRLHVKKAFYSGWDYLDKTVEKHQKTQVMWIDLGILQPCNWTCVSGWDILFNRYNKYYHYKGFSIDAWYPGHAVEHFSR